MMIALRRYRYRNMIDVPPTGGQISSSVRRLTMVISRLNLFVLILPKIYGAAHTLKSVVSTFSRSKIMQWTPSIHSFFFIESRPLHIKPTTSFLSNGINASDTSTTPIYQLDHSALITIHNEEEISESFVKQEEKQERWGQE